MTKLSLSIDIRDFDLEKVGFSISVLDQVRRRPTSEAYLRMTLTELNAFLKALKQAKDDIELTTAEQQKSSGRSGSFREVEAVPAPAAELREAAG